MFGISPKNGVKKHFFRPEKEHGFSPGFYSARHTTFSGEKTCIIDLVTLAVSPRTTVPWGAVSAGICSCCPMMILVGARSGTTGLQAMGGSARARAKHELHHVIVARAPHEPHLDRFAAQLPDWLSTSALRQSRS